MMKTRPSVSLRTVLLLSGVLSLLSVLPASRAAAPQSPSDLGEYVALGWNDLGMHCMNGDFSSLCVLPPYNTLWVQVIRRGDPPQLVSAGVTLTYRFPLNTDSAGKVNFWDHEDGLFGVDLPPNVGLTGHGLAGELEWNGTAFEVTGVPLTPFEDDAPTVERPYQLAEVTVTDSSSTAQLDQTVFVAPVSIEMHCERCHSGGDRPVWDNILIKHGENLINMKPVLCAGCHASNALGTPGVPGVPNLSEAMHGGHVERVADDDCYACHPGTQTQCQRGAMFLAGKHCVDCHGTLRTVAESIKDGRRPWLDEPRCGTAGCHPQHAENPGKLYRQSIGHGGVYCAACHNSPHAELPTVQSRDGIQAVRVQGEATYIRDCLVCHTRPPDGPGPHGMLFQSVAILGLY